MIFDEEQLIRNTEKTLDYKKMNSNTLFIKSLVYFKPSKLRVFISILLLLVFYLLFYFYGFQNIQALRIVMELTQQLNLILLPIFAVIITGYAIFQGLMSGNTLILLSNITHDKGSKFEVYNLYFFGLSSIYLFAIIMNNMLLFLSKILPLNFSVSLFTNSFNELVSSVLLSVYLVFILNIILYMKNFTYNLFQVFITNGTTTVIDTLKKKKEAKDRH